MRNSPKWLQEFQYFRAISILEIIILHTTLIFVPSFLGIASLLLVSAPLRAIFALIDASALLAVPQFVFISGFVLYNKYKRNFSVRQFYKKRLNAVLWPYLIFSVFYFIFEGFFLYHYISIGVIPIVKSFAEGIVTGTIGALWFVALLLQFYLLYPLLARVYNRFARRWSVALGVLTVVLFLQITYSSIFVFVPDINGPTNFRIFFLSNIFYFMLGIFACEHYTTIKQKLEQLSLPLFIVVVGLAAVSYTIIFNSFYFEKAPAYFAWLFSLVELVYCVLLIVFWLKVSIIWTEQRSLFTRFMDKIGEDSFGLYLTHLFFIEIFGLALILIGLSLTSLLYYVVLFVLVLAASYTAVHLIYRLPFSQIIIGKPRRTKDVESIAPEKSSFDVT
jgi:peptidoglycan/LPS O-acetylase OafA/YrhL